MTVASQPLGPREAQPVCHQMWDNHSRVQEENTKLERMCSEKDATIESLRVKLCGNEEELNLSRRRNTELQSAIALCKKELEQEKAKSKDLELKLSECDKHALQAAQFQLKDAEGAKARSQELVRVLTNEITVLREAQAAEERAGVESKEVLLERSTDEFTAQCMTHARVAMQRKTQIENDLSTLSNCIGMLFAKLQCILPREEFEKCAAMLPSANRERVVTPFHGKTVVSRAMAAIATDNAMLSLQRGQEKHPWQPFHWGKSSQTPEVLHPITGMCPDASYAGMSQADIYQAGASNMGMFQIGGSQPGVSKPGMSQERIWQAGASHEMPQIGMFEQGANQPFVDAFPLVDERSAEEVFIG